MPLTFAVLGDIHALDPTVSRAIETESHREGVARCARFRQEVLPVILEEIRAASPAFVLQTGDLLDGGAIRDEDARLEAEEILDELRALDVPIWMAQGNHDFSPAAPGLRAWDGVLRPHLQRQLGHELSNAYYEFSVSDARFFVLDYRDRSPEQMTWLSERVSAARSNRRGRRERLFLVAHAPLHSVARPFFCDPVFTRGVHEAVGGQPIDAYFCGHTHNQCVSLHPWGGGTGVRGGSTPADPLAGPRPLRGHPGATRGATVASVTPVDPRRQQGRLLQVKCAAIGEANRAPIPLAAVRAILQAGQPELLWGYLEDTAPGWTLVTVRDEDVILEWRSVSSAGPSASPSGSILHSSPIVARLRWREPGIVDALEVPEIRPSGLAAPDVPRIRSARLYLAFWGSRDPEKKVFVNGVPIGAVPPGDWFIPRSFVSLPPEGLRALRRINDVTITNPNGEEFAVGGAHLEVILDDGRVVRSTASDFLMATGPRWDAWAEPLLLRVPPGDPVELRALRFPPA